MATGIPTTARTASPRSPHRTTSGSRSSSAGTGSASSRRSIPEWAVAAKADSFWQLLMLHGAIGDGFEVELLSYEVPTYFGMLTASFTRKD